MPRNMRRTQKVALAAVFASVHAVLFLPEGPWRSFVIYLMPIEGIVLGPVVGVSAALLGSTVARLIKPTPLWMFGVVAEPIGVLVAALLAKGRWKETLAIYSVMLAAYFLHPYGQTLPLWTILDILVAFALIYPASRVGRSLWNQNPNRLLPALILIAFVSTVADSLTRVFLLVPADLHNYLGLPYESLYLVFIEGAVGSYIEDALVIAATVVAGVPLLLALKKILGLEKPLS